MKQNILVSVIVTLVILMSSSCKDFLQNTEYGSLTNDQYWKTESDLKSAVDGLYFWTGGEGTTGRGFMWYDNASDNSITGRDKSGAAILKNFTETGNTDRDVTNEWPSMYQLIRRANNILLYAPSMNVSTSVQNAALGEAYFYRAFAYLWLAPWYGDNISGGLPIMLPTTPVDSMDMARPSTVLKNYATIIDDLKKASRLVPYFQNLPASSYGRPHKTACWAFIARAALYAAQYDNSYYAVASQYCDSVILSGRHALVGNYANFFTEAQNYGSEYIWNLPSNEVRGSEFPGVIFENAGWGLYNTWGYYPPTLDLYNEYEQGDSRRSVTIVYPGDTVSFIGTKNISYGVRKLTTAYTNINFGTFKDLTTSGVSSPSKVTIGKYLSPFAGADCVGKTVNTSGDYPTTRLCPPVLRYADVLLMKAEVMIQLKGAGAGDTWINLVRNRAGLKSISGGDMKALKHERRCEFACEFGAYRYIDLVRWGDAKTQCEPAMSGLLVKSKDYKFKSLKTGNDTIATVYWYANWRKPDASFPSGYSINKDSVNTCWPARTWNDRNRVFAIPNSVISASKTLIQNKDY